MTACPRCKFENSEPSRFCPSCGFELAAQAREIRKTVTVVYSDVVGSTALGETHDPEVLRRALGRYFEEARTVIERHGGSVEMFIGDAVVALFGVPVAREDDALRALRAASEIRERLETLNDDFEREIGFRIGVRTGVHTGEVVVGDTSLEGFRASGDTMNVGARLEQSAAAGEILIGQLTRELGGEAIVVEAVEPLVAKGKAEPLVAYRLVRVLEHVSPYTRRQDAPLVGRQRELALLRDATDRAEVEQACVLATIVGPAGVGKSRLIREFLTTLSNSTQQLVGRCLSYGEGITFGPLAEALGPLLGENPRARVLELLEGDERAESAADGIGTALGFGDDDRGTAGEETFWAFRRLFEAIAREHPLVLVVDDIHWAEPRLLDLLEYVSTFSSGARVTILCLSRPELLEERPTWAAPRENTFVTVLSPLGDDESLAFVENLIGGHALSESDVRQIVDAAAGNPLYLEQLLALDARRDHTGALVIPPTIQALLAARLDQLGESDRTLLECAAIEGREFHRNLVGHLLHPRERDGMGTSLLSLARRQFIRPLRDERSGDDAFAFVHTLVRDSAYAAIPKQDRADMHVALADFLEQSGDGVGEIVGFHLADAVRYRLELGLDDELTRELARRSAESLAAGGAHALALGDDRAAAKLLSRASELVAVDDPIGRALRLELGRALAGSGRLEPARATFADVAIASGRAGERVGQLRADLGLLNLRMQMDPQLANAHAVASAEGALEELSTLVDERGLALAWWLIHWGQFRSGRYLLSVDAAEHAIRHARRAGDRREELRALGAIAIATLLGATPVDEGLARCDELVARAGGARLVEAFAARARGCLFAMKGDFDRGREECDRAVGIYEELGLSVSAIGVVAERERVERLAGDLDRAERDLRAASDRLREIGDVGYLSWIVPMLARVLALQGEIGEAIELARGSRREMQPDHATGQIASRLAEGIALRLDGQATAAEAVALEALELVEATDASDIHSEVLLLLADLDSSSGRDELARERSLEALALYEQKGNLVSAARVRELGYVQG